MNVSIPMRSREGSDATPWSSGVGARRVRVRTAGLRLGLLLFAAGLLRYGTLLTEAGRDLARHAWVRIETSGRMIAGLAYTSDGARLVSADYLDCARKNSHQRSKWRRTRQRG
jgi:hypothetical protein